MSKTKSDQALSNTMTCFESAIMELPHIMFHLVHLIHKEMISRLANLAQCSDFPRI